MINRNWVVSLGVASVLVLGACGGGGEEVSTAPTPTPAPKPNPIQKPTVEGAKGKGIRYNISTSDIWVTGGPSVSNQSVIVLKSEPTPLGSLGTFTVIVDGYEIDVDVPGKKYSKLSRDEAWALGANPEANAPNSYVKQYEWHKDLDKLYRFYVGIPTSNMPTTGIASYNSFYNISALDFNHADGGNDNAGKFELKADFANRKINGVINNVKFSDTPSTVAIGGDINGNTFTGTVKLEASAHQKGFKDGTVTGGFFGPKAVEVAGVGAQTGGNGKQTWGMDFIGKK